MSFHENNELREYNNFISTTAVSVPPTTTAAIFQSAKKAQSFFKLTVFGKLISIHSFVGFLSLSVCHQFGMNPFNSRISLSDYFMHFGHSACMLFCGFLFVGLSLAIARLLLNRAEFNHIRRSYFLQIFILCSLSLGVFMALGAQMSFSIAALWIIGGYIGSSFPTYLLAIKKAY